MNKSQVIELSLQMLANGITSMPKYNPYHNDYEIMVTTTVYNDNVSYLCKLYNLNFIDFGFMRYEGQNTQDFPIFCRLFND